MSNHKCRSELALTDVILLTRLKYGYYTKSYRQTSLNHVRNGMDNKLKGRDSREVQRENEIECIPPDGMELARIYRAHVLHGSSASILI